MSLNTILDHTDIWLAGSDTDLHQLWCQGHSPDSAYELLREDNCVRVPLNCFELIAGITALMEGF